VKRVAVVMGSASDQPKATEHVMSAHRTPRVVSTFAAEARSHGYGVIICGAGMAAHLAGAVAAQCSLPVIGVPLTGGALGGIDALYSTVQMPRGVPVATVAIDGAANAAVLAVEILAVEDNELAKRLDSFRAEWSR
jgi:5-(carboxyamino)imidazole ribonucleotide mutase